MRYPVLALALTILGCGGHRHEPKDPKPDPRVEDLREAVEKGLNEAASLRDAEGWLTPTDGDGMLWTGKYAATGGVSGVNLLAAEVEPGRFDRNPYHPTSANPQWSSWSRDMGAGFLAAEWRGKDLATLQRHVTYGRAHSWQMGEPFGDGRSTYTPAFLGRLFQVVYALGGENDPNRHWPDLYPKGLVDYQAHLQVLGIWQEGEVAEEMAKTGKSDDAKPAGPPTVDDGFVLADVGGELYAVDPERSPLLLDVTDSQFEILKAQATRDPRDPLFAVVFGIYTGEMGPALDACLEADQYAGEYVRCDEYRRCQLAAWLFACDLVLRRFP